jgi:hypothetical protein
MPAALVAQHGVEIVLDQRAVAQHGGVELQRVGPAEEQHRLVDQMRAQVHPQAGARHRLFAPALAAPAAGSGRNAIPSTPAGPGHRWPAAAQVRKSASKRRFW